MTDFNSFPDPQQQSAQQQPQQYGGQPQYGGNMPPQKKSNSGRNIILLACGCMMGLTCLVVVCCVGMFALVLNSGGGSALIWGTAITAENYDFARSMTCDNSQATTFTDQMETRGATFTSFNASDELDSDGITVDATIVVDGRSSTWNATFYTESGGGIFGNCVSRIEGTIPGGS